MNKALLGMNFHFLDGQHQLSLKKWDGLSLATTFGRRWTESIGKMMCAGILTRHCLESSTTREAWLNDFREVLTGWSEITGFELQNVGDTSWEINETLPTKKIDSRRFFILKWHEMVMLGSDFWFSIYIYTLAGSGLGWITPKMPKVKMKLQAASSWEGFFTKNGQYEDTPSVVPIKGPTFHWDSADLPMKVGIARWPFCSSNNVLQMCKIMAASSVT